VKFELHVPAPEFARGRTRQMNAARTQITARFPKLKERSYATLRNTSW